MEIKDLLFSLMVDYMSGKITSDEFAQAYSNNYNLELDYDSLNEQESSLLSKISIVANRFSSDEEELLIKNLYFGPQELFEVVHAACEDLKLM